MGSRFTELVVETVMLHSKLGGRRSTPIAQVGCEREESGGTKNIFVFGSQVDKVSAEPFDKRTEQHHDRNSRCSANNQWGWGVIERTVFT